MTWAERRSLAKTANHKPAPFIAEHITTTTEVGPTSDQGFAVMTRFDSWDVRATEFVLGARSELRYVQSRGMWLYWDGYVWKWDTTGKAQELAKEFGRSFIHAAPGETDEAKRRRVAWYKNLTAPKGIKDILTLAKTDPMIAAMLEEFDAVVYELNTPDGVVNLKTAAVTPPDPARLVRRSTTIAPDHTCSTVRYENLLAEAFMGQPELSDYFEAMMGVTLLKGQLEQVFLYMYGKAGSGKGTLMNLAKDILGTGESGYAAYVDSDLFVHSSMKQHPTEMMQFLGARMVITSEITQEQKMDTGKLKRTTGGDAITGRYMGKDYVTFDPTHTLWLMANDRLQVPHNDQGVWRRLRVIPFEFAKRETEMTSGLDKLIFNNEAPGILARWIAKAGDYLRDGLYTPSVVLAAREEYIKEQDTVSMWMEFCTSSEESGAFTRYAALRESYMTWCRQEKKTAVGTNAFPAALKALGFQHCKKYIDEGGERRQVRGYVGIQIL